MRAASAILVLALAASAFAGSPAEAVAAAYADAQRLAPHDAAHARYAALWTLPPEGRAKFIQLMRYVYNSVNTSPDGFAPLAVVPGDLVRIDLRDFGAAFADVWDNKTPDADPIFHLLVDEEVASEEEVEVGYAVDAGGRQVAQGTPGSRWVKTGTRKKPKKIRKAVAAPWLPVKETVGLETLTGSRSPVLSAEWLVARMSRQLNLNNKDDGTGFYNWMGIKNRDDFFKVIRFSEADSVAVGKDIKAAVDAADSGVAQNGRQIVWRAGPTGGVWITLDSDHTDADGNPTHNLKDGEFKPAAQEIYAPLPNGLPGKILTKFVDGSLQASAPDFIGGNGSPGYGGRDLRIHNPLSCDDCHGKEILRPIDDWVRKNFVGDLQLRTPDHETYRQFRRQFFSNLKAQLERDRAAYVAAIHDCCGMTPEEMTAAVDDQWRRYALTPLSPADFALWLGVDEKTLIGRFRAYNAASGGIDPLFAPLIGDKPGAINRQNSEELYGAAQFLLKGYQVP